MGNTVTTYHSQFTEDQNQDCQQWHNMDGTDKQDYEERIFAQYDKPYDYNEYMYYCMNWKEVTDLDKHDLTNDELVKALSQRQDENKEVEEKIWNIISPEWQCFYNKEDDKKYGPYSNRFMYRSIALPEYNIGQVHAEYVKNKRFHMQYYSNGAPETPRDGHMDLGNFGFFKRPSSLKAGGSLERTKTSILAHEARVGRRDLPARREFNAILRQVKQSHML